MMKMIIIILEDIIEILEVFIEEEIEEELLIEEEIEVLIEEEMILEGMMIFMKEKIII